MKKVSLFFVTLIAALLVFAGVSGAKEAEAAEFKDLLMEEFFPTGLRI